MGVFHFSEDELEQLKNWLLAIIKPWSDADPMLLAQYIITILVGEGKSIEEIKAKFEDKLAIFTAAKTSEFVKFLFEALDKKSYIGTVKPSPIKDEKADKTKNETIEPKEKVESIEKFLLEFDLEDLDDLEELDELEVTKDEKLSKATEKLVGPDSYSNPSQRKIRDSRFEKEKKSDNKKQTAKDQHSRHHKSFDSSNASKKSDKTRQHSKTQKSSHDPYTWKHSDKFQYGKTKNVDKFPSKSETITSSHDKASTVSRYTYNWPIPGQAEADEHSRLCPKIQEKGVCSQGMYCPYNPAAPNVSGSSIDQYEHLINKNYNFDLEQYARQNSPIDVDMRPSFLRQQYDVNASNQQFEANVVNQNQEFQEFGSDEIEFATSLIVKQIPVCLNHVQNLINYFKKFGTIVNCKVNFQNDPSAAFVQFSDPFEATQAVRSPEAVFNNRFIKVYRANKVPNDKSQSPSIDVNHPFGINKRKSLNLSDEIADEISKKPKPLIPKVDESQEMFNVNSLKQSIDEALANHERLMKKLDESETLAEKKEVMNLLEYNTRMITELKEKIESLI